MSDAGKKESYLVMRERRLRSEADLVKAVNHPTAKGEHLEGLLSNFLKEELPEKYAVDSGFVIGLRRNLKDSIEDVDANVRSCEMDVVIYDKQNNTSPLRLLSKKDFFAESVCGVISVKKNLTKQMLVGGKGNIFNNLLSARLIIPHHYNSPVTGEDRSIDVSGVFTSVQIVAAGFTYDGIELEQIKNVLDSQIPNHGRNWYEKMPNLIAVLGKGVVSLESSNDKKEYVITETPENTLEEFFFHLLERLNGRLERPSVGIRAYRNFYSSHINSTLD